MQQGEILNIPTDNPLTEERAWSVFRDLILGLEYRKCNYNIPLKNSYQINISLHSALSTNYSW